jgi:hypothetical protein
MVVFCPGCGSRISVEPGSQGGDVECPRCHSTFSTGGLKEAVDAPPPKRFRPKKAGQSKLAVAGIVLAVLLVLGGGTAGVLYYTGMLGRWFGGPGGSSATRIVTQPSWQEYSNAEGKFSVLFPGTPTRDTMPTPTKLKPGEKPRVVSFTVETPDGSYSVAYDEFDKRSDTPDQFVEKQRAELAAGHGGKLVSEKEVTVGTHKGKEFVVEVPNRGTAHMRFVAAGRRLYKVTALGTRRPPDASDVAKFFESFQIIG